MGAQENQRMFLFKSLEIGLLSLLKYEDGINIIVLEISF